MAEKSMDDLQAAWEKMEDQITDLRAKQQAIGAEMNERRGNATARTIYEGIDKGSLPAIVRMGTIELGAKPGSVEAKEDR